MKFTFEALIDEAVKSGIGGVRTCFPGKVVKANVPEGWCNVQPALRRTYSDGTTAEPPVINKVPIASYRAGNAFISLPLKVGDWVLVVCSERDIDLWKTKGGITTPKELRTFHIADAIAYPGVYPFSEPPEGASADDIVIRNGDSKVTVKPSEIHLWGSGDAVALASLVLARLNQIKTAFDTHVHSGVTAGAGTSGPPPSGIGTINSVASTKVKAE
jgi:hypothetical protein